MKKQLPVLACLLSATACAQVPEQLTAANIPPPAVAAHQHLVSRAFSTDVLDGKPVEDGQHLLELLDEGGIRRGVVLSMAYSFADERKKLPNPDQKVRNENDWTSTQIARSNGRLIGFCGINPLRNAAIAEIDRCLELPGMVGVKMHFGNSGVSLDVADHLTRLKQIFSAANAHGAPMIIHLRTRTGKPYTPEQAKLLLEKLLPSAPHSIVQIAHLAGSGPGFPADAQAAFNVFATAIERSDPRTRNLYFDQTTVPSAETSPEEGAQTANAIRRVGLTRVFFGSDMVIGGNLTPRQSWEIFKSKVSLTPTEFTAIAKNVPPYWPR